MKGRHDTLLVYVHDQGELDVGVVACVPRKGEIVELNNGDTRMAYCVEQVTWVVGNAPIGAFVVATSTIVRVGLSRCR